MIVNSGLVRQRSCWPVVILAVVATGFAEGGVWLTPAPCWAGYQTGIVLEGRSADDPPPAEWTVTGAESETVVARLRGQWGLVEVPPGEYTVQLLPQGSGAVATSWTTVSVAAGNSTVVKIDSGIDLRGHSDDADALEYWNVFNADDSDEDTKPVAVVYRRRGFTPLPAGQYRLEVQPGELGRDPISWGTVAVEAGTITAVKLSSGIELAVGKACSEPPYQWLIYPAKDRGKPLTRIFSKWGVTPLPPGEYQLVIQPGDLGRDEVPWATIKLEADEIVTVKLDSGIELAGLTAETAALYQWLIYDVKDPGKPLTRIFSKWGVTPLPRGEYQLVVQPGDLGRDEVSWATIKLEADEIVTVKLDSGIELTGLTAESTPPYQWLVYDAKNQDKPLTRVFGQWGVTSLPPGEYVVVIQPGDLGQEEIPWTTIKLKAGEIATVKIDSGIELGGLTAGSAPPYQWLIYDARDQSKRLTRIVGQWGVTSLPPGEYLVVIQPGDLGHEEIPWATIKLTASEFATVKIDSGIELTGKSSSSEPPEQWLIYDAKDRTKPITKIYGHWGLSPLPPGEYAIEISSGENARNVVRWAEVKVNAGIVSKVDAEPPLEARLATVTGAGRQQEKKLDPDGYKRLEEEIERSIRRGAAWLKTQAALDLDDLDDHYATIGVLALVHSGELERDPELRRRCIDYLLRRSLNAGYATYATSLTAMALRDIDPYRYRKRIFDCAQWLVENQGWEPEQYRVWGYGRAVPGLDAVEAPDLRGRVLRERQTDIRAERQQLLEVVRRGSVAELDSSWDNSNAQFATLGLHSAANSGVGIPRRSWERIAGHFNETQCPDGGWGYGNSNDSYGSMSCAGLASLVMARHHLGEQPLLLDPSVVAGLEWLTHYFTVDENPHMGSDHYYYLYGLERAGILAGTEFFGSHEWYPAGARYLLKNQKVDGSWHNEECPSTGSPHDYLDTCYAILFLRRATLPLEPAKPAFLAVSAGREDLPAALLPAVEVILDSSGSMRDIVGDQTKIKIAQSVMADVLGKLPRTIQLGFRLYGHREGNVVNAPASGLDPAAKVTRLVVPIAPLTDAHRATIAQWVDQAAPWGWTPMVYSVLQAKDDFPRAASSSQTVVLISDGIDTCGGKIEEIGNAYHGSGIDIVLHVVGFDVDKDPAAKKQLMQIATLGGGKYFDARDAEGLSTALDEALQGIEFVVTDAETGSEVARGGINEEPLTLEPGKYLVGIGGLKSDPFPVELAADQLLELILDQEGKLLVSESGDE